MKLITRKHGSQRASKSEPVTIEPNWCGEGGNAKLTLKTADGIYLMFQVESDEEARALMSASHIIYKNLGDKRV